MRNQTVELVPGRAAATVELSAEEVGALEAIMLKAGNNRKTGDYSKRLEAEGVPFDMYRGILLKLGKAEQMLDGARG